jgi:hypothetical protein
MARLSVLRDLWAFIRLKKKYWLIPVVIVLLLVGVFLFLGEGSAVAPLIYTLF